MTTKPTLRVFSERWRRNIVAKVTAWPLESESAKGIRSPHFWIIMALMAFCSFLYYVDQTPLAGISPFNSNFFTGVHDAIRTLFLIPIIYAALLFRLRGSLIASFAFFVVVLPRALLYSPYPEPLLRPLLFVFLSALVSLLLAVKLNLTEKERKASAESRKLHQEFLEYRQRFEIRIMEQQEQLIQAEKLTSLGQMAASIAHEINNPLTGVLFYTQLLIKRIGGDNIAKETILDNLSKMETELIRSTKLTRNLLDFARQSPPTLSEVNVNDILNRAIDLTAFSVEKQPIQVIKEFAPSLPKLTADFNQLQQVFTNLILNAFQAMPEGGRLILRTSTDNGEFRIEVQDTGCGIPPQNMPKLFTPFFTTKKEVKGVGLGLAVSLGIIQRHGGRIEVQSKEGEGTTFTIRLPLKREEHAQG